MIESPVIFIVLLVAVAAGFFALERATGWRIFKVMPPIVLIYLGVTALAVVGTWQPTPAIALVQKTITREMLPALLFLLLATCDLRAIMALGPRVLGAFFCATFSILLAFVLVFSALGGVLGEHAPKALAALSGGWMGGTANLLAVKQSVNLDSSALTQVLVTDAVCYSAWVMLLFAAAPFAERFNQWAGAANVAEFIAPPTETLNPARPKIWHLLIWLLVAWLISTLAQYAASVLPTSEALSATSWTLLLVTLAGIVCARTPLAKLPGSSLLGSALLALVVAALASQSTFDGLASAPMFVLAGFLILAVHALLMLGLARLFRFDLFTCSVCSLANIGGVASAPLLAALHSPSLVPVGVLLAMLGYVIGTGLGIALAAVLQTIGIFLGYSL